MALKQSICIQCGALFFDKKVRFLCPHCQRNLEKTYLTNEEEYAETSNQ